MSQQTDSPVPAGARTSVAVLQTALNRDAIDRHADREGDEAKILVSAGGGE